MGLKVILLVVLVFFVAFGVRMSLMGRKVCGRLKSEQEVNGRPARERKEGRR